MTYLELIARVDHGYFMLGEINKKLSVKEALIVQMIDNTCECDEAEEMRNLAIDVIRDIIKCKNFLYADCSKDIAMLDELKKNKTIIEMNKSKYHYSIRFSHFNIYRDNGDGTASKIGDRATEEEARKEVYRLNGWEYKPKTIRQ